MTKKQISEKSQHIVLGIMTIIAIAYTIFRIYYHDENKHLIQLVFLAIIFLSAVLFNNNFEMKEVTKKTQIRKRTYYSVCVIAFVAFIAFAIFTLTSHYENKELIGSICMSILLVIFFFFNVFFTIKK